MIDEAEEVGEWVLAARALNDLVQNVPPATQAEHAAMLERMRVDAERAGFESLAVAAYFQGKARLAIREGDLTAAIHALERAPRARPRVRAPRPARRLPRRLPGWALPRGRQLDAVDEIIDDIRGLPGVTGMVIPGLAFHVACRRGDLEAAERWLDEVFRALKEQPWRSGSQAHDLVSAAITVGLPASGSSRWARRCSTTTSGTRTGRWSTRRSTR